ncbi:MAG: outer membrane protein assembly factor BamD [Nitrospirae bacterium]|nr:outer membrane protein assembly factor BamD [Nitrospirota bacterium]
MRKIRGAYFFIVFLVIVFSCAKKPELKLSADSEFEDSFEKANKYIEEKQYEDARDLLNKIKTYDTTDKYAPLAQLRLADSYLKEEEPEIAMEEYSRFLDMYSRHIYAAYAQYQIAMIYFKEMTDAERGYESAKKALEELETLNSLYPRNPYKEEVASMIEKSKETIADHEFLVGKFYFKKKAYKGALARLVGVLEMFPDYKNEEEVLFLIHTSYKALGDNDKAGQYLDLLMTKYPESKLGAINQ